jgi:aspartate carbamoyltransferase catalytic subunit
MSQFDMEALLVSPAEMSLTGDLKAELDERSVVHRQVDSVEECISDAGVICMEPVVQADYTKAREEAAGDRPRTPAAYRVTPSWTASTAAGSPRWRSSACTRARSGPGTG